MYEVFVDEYPFPGGDDILFIQRFYADRSFDHIDELQVLMPVHDPEAGVQRIGNVVFHIQNKVWKLSMEIQIHRVDVLVLNAHGVVSLAICL